MNLDEKLARIRDGVGVLQKDKDGYGYKYLSEEAIMSRLNTMFKKYGVNLYPSIVPGTLEITPVTYQNIKVVKGQPVENTVHEVLVSGQMKYRWKNLDDPSDYLDVDWVFVGQQADPSQSFGSALTYTHRQFAMKFFGFSVTADDPDALRSQQDELYVRTLIEEVDVMVKEHLTDEKKAEFTDLVKKVTGGSANYFKVADKRVAEQLVKAVATYFNVAE